MIKTKTLSPSQNQGMSVIEVIVAIAIFIIIASGSVSTIVGSFNSIRLAEEETFATNLASSGIEAVNSIANTSWENIIPGTYGLDLSSGLWTLTANPDITTKYTRTITISPVYRDLNNDISSTGTPDPDTYQISSSVSWNFAPLRLNTVTHESLITNWVPNLGSGISTTPITTCNQYCLSVGYSSGTCRVNSQQCTINNEIYQLGGDPYCTDPANLDTCCCLP